MITFTIFALSGLVVSILIFAKLWELKQRKSFILMRLISRGDTRFRTLSHNVTEDYSKLKEKTEFFIQKQLPLHTKNIINKIETISKEKTEKYIGNLRDARILNKNNEGISEFFQNVKDLEEETAAAIKDMDAETNEIVEELDPNKKKI